MTDAAHGRALATRTALVDLAAELFSEQGYLQTSIRDVARRASVTTGAIYGHFRGKADLLAAAISERTHEELEALATVPGREANHVEALTRLGAQYARRRRLRALIVQGAAAAQTDDETRERLRDEQLAHLKRWIDGYEANRGRLGIDPSVDMQSAVLYSWAAEVGLGVLEALGIEPRTRKGWADASGRFARGLTLPPQAPP
jgi:AcrR family transcriptional regulator